MTVIARVKPVPGVSTMTLRDGKVLLVKRAKKAGYGLWSLPGGHIETGEPARDAALRELAEETGVTARLDRLLECQDIIHRDTHDTIIFHYVISVFLCYWQHGEAVAATDVSDVMWASERDLDGLNMTRGTADLIRNTLKTLT
ncbi:MAG: NUDIX hydrolase [Pseudomonadota bacterium]